MPIRCGPVVNPIHFCMFLLFCFLLPWTYRIGACACTGRPARARRRHQAHSASVPHVQERWHHASRVAGSREVCIHTDDLKTSVFLFFFLLVYRCHEHRNPSSVVSEILRMHSTDDTEWASNNFFFFRFLSPLCFVGEGFAFFYQRVYWCHSLCNPVSWFWLSLYVMFLTSNRGSERSDSLM